MNASASVADPKESRAVRPPPTSLLTLFLVALAIRVIFFLLVHISMGDDDGSQFQIAQNIVAGHGYLTTRPHFPIPYRAFLPPFFPVLAAGAIKLFGAHAILALRLFASLCGALTCVVIARLGERLMNSPRGRWAGWALAFYPGHIIWSTRLLAEPAVMLFYPLAIYLVLVTAPRLKSGWLFVAGVLCALSALGRGEFLLLVAVLGGWILWHQRTRAGIRLTAALFVGFALGMSPWVIRNAIVFNRLVLTASNYGENFYFAHSPYYHFGGEAFDLPPAIEARLKGLDEHQIEEVYLNTGKGFVMAHPWLTCYSTFVNALVFWRPNLTPGYVALGPNLFYTFFGFILLTFFAYGILLILKLNVIGDWLLILIVIGYKFFIHLPFYMVVRFREALSPLLVLVATFGFICWRERQEKPSV